MRHSFHLALCTLVRGRVLALLLAAVALVHWLLPDFVRSDGTAAGALEMWVRAVPGVVDVIVLLVVLVVACGLFAREREEKRLALTLVRPAHALGVAYGKWLALIAVAAVVLLCSSALTLLFPPASAASGLPPCRHHYEPTMPPAAEVAGHLLESYLADPQTPEAVKKASRSAVLTLLTTKEIDRYDVVKPGASMIWPYGLEALQAKIDVGEPLALGVRFSTQFEMRAPVAGKLRLGPYMAVVSNTTQSVLEIPLKKVDGVSSEKDGRLDLVFDNTGKSAVMVRPRRDLVVLARADSFAWNLLRAQLEILALAALLAAYGLFLSASLSRPVAVFTALVTFLIVLMAPRVVAQFPDEFNAEFADRIGLALSRAVSAVTASVSAPSPVSDLATGKAIEWPDLGRLLLGNVFLFPFVLLALAAFVARRKALPDMD